MSVEDYPKFTQILDDSDIKVRVVAIMGLAHVNEEAVETELRKALLDESPAMKWAAAWASCKRENYTEETVEILLDAMIAPQDLDQILGDALPTSVSTFSRARLIYAPRPFQARIAERCLEPE